MKKQAANDEPEFDEETLHFAWVFHFIGQEPETGVFMTPANHRQALAFHPCAIAAIPIKAAAVKVACRTCRHLAKPGTVAHCGGRTDLLPAYGINHPLRLLSDDGGANCGQWKGRNHGDVGSKRTQRALSPLHTSVKKPLSRGRERGWGEGGGASRNDHQCATALFPLPLFFREG